MKKLAFKFFFGLVMAVSMTNCSSCGGDEDDDLCDHDKISAKVFKNYMEKQNVIQLVDYRKAEDFNAGHIPGAVNIPAVTKDLDGENGNCEYVKKVMEQFDTNYPILIYGGNDSWGLNGNVVPGQVACKFGSDKTTLLDGGFKAWETEFPDLVEKN